MPDTCLYSGLVAPNTDLIYALTSLTTSINPVFGKYKVLFLAIRALLYAVVAPITPVLVEVKFVNRVFNAVTLMLASLGIYKGSEVSNATIFCIVVY